MRLPRIPRPDIDLQDVHIYGGLVIAAVGGWQLSPAWTMVAAGLALLALGVGPHRGKAS
jgi:hypothetical protein